MNADLVGHLWRHAATSPDSAAVSELTVAGWTTTTWGELGAAVADLAGRAAPLRAAGRPVVLVTDNSTTALVLLLGLAAAAVDTLYVERDNSYLSDPGSAPRGVDAAAMILPDGSAAAGPGTLTYRELLGGDRPGPAGGPPATGAPEALQLTSGSTGDQRVVRHPMANIEAGGRLYRDLYAYTARDRVLLPLPLAHSFGLVAGAAASLVAGAELLLTPTVTPRFLHAAIDRGATIVLGTPLLYRLLSMTAPPRGHHGDLRLLLSSGGPLPGDVAAETARRLGLPVRQVYGSTETGLIACQRDRPEPWPDGSVGRPVPGADLSFTSDGRLVVSTATMFAGYHGEPDRPTGPYPIGDLARVDGSGDLYLTGRKETFVNVGGRKVNPRRVERLVADHPGVREVHVLGLEEQGEEGVHAVVVPAGPGAVDGLLDFCRARLRPYEVPRRVHVVERIPRTAMGKIHRQTLVTYLGFSAHRKEHGDRMSNTRCEDYVAVVGLGYIGLPLAASLAAAGTRVVGVDTNPAVRAAVRAGHPPFHEPGLAALLAELPPGALSVTDSVPAEPPRGVVVCVGTAVHPDSGRPDLRHLEQAVDQVAERIAPDTVVIVRSTVPVGTTRDLVLPRLAARVPEPTLAFCPERTIQGTALAELAALPQIIGGLDAHSAERAGALLKPVMTDQVVVSSPEAAEMVKLICNAHTDLIYGFGNEVALMAESLGLDAVELIDAANLRYPRPDLSRPGFVGGSCLVKDPYLLIHASTGAGHRPVLVEAARAVNESIPRHVTDLVLRALADRPGGRAGKVLVCGIAYKGHPETDDVRGAASAEVAAALAGRVEVLAGHDHVVHPDRVARLGFEPMDLDAGLRDADALVLLTDHPGYRSLDAGYLTSRMRPDPVVFDMWGALAGRLSKAAGIRYLRLGRG
nr:nucleotide sugar dehydrogenase [Micromonospora sp. DSM 115978]